MTIKYNFSGIEGATYPVQGSTETIQGLLDEGSGDTGAAQAKPFLTYTFGTVFTTNIDWSQSGDRDAFDFAATDTGAAASRQLQSFVVEFDRPVDPVVSEDVYGFKAMDAGADAAIGPGESFTYTIDPREVGAIIIEYAVML